MGVASTSSAASPGEVCGPRSPSVRAMPHTAEHHRGTLPSQGLSAEHVMNPL